MNTKLLSAAGFALALLGSGTAMASEATQFDFPTGTLTQAEAQAALNRTKAATELFLDTLPNSAFVSVLSPAEVRAQALHGEASPLTEANRTIVIAPATRYVNVMEGDVVKFVASGREFAYKFDGANFGGFDLQSVAPAGALQHAVMTYVAPNPDELGGRGGRGR